MNTTDYSKKYKFKGRDNSKHQVSVVSSITLICVKLFSNEMEVSTCINACMAMHYH